MSRTRAELDAKLAALQARVSEMTPQRLSERYMPDYFIDRLIGGVLTLVGVKMAWSMFRARLNHRDRVRAHVAAYGHW